MMAPVPVSLFDLLKFLALFVCKIGSYLPMRLSYGLMHTPARLSSNVSELRCCLVDDRRNLGELFRCQVELGAEPFLHAPADQFRTMKRKEMMLRIQSSQERATNSPGDKHEDKCGNEFPLQRAVHLKNSS